MPSELTASNPFGRLLFGNHLRRVQLNLEYARELQAVAAARRIDKLLGPAHVILAGDLTHPPDFASVRFWTGRQSLAGVSVCYRDTFLSVLATAPES